ncbi:MAG: NCS2 family permease [Candidatus Cyclobacteriaceae bacterium M3_2C_046]
MKFFKLKENGTDLRTEFLAAVTTFFTMGYIIFVNPAILAKTGMDFNSVLIATCLASALGTLIMGLLANYPFALAPGMGLNAFFSFTVVFSLGYTWQQALAAVFLSGLFFIILTLTGLRKRIIQAIPAYIKHAIPAGIGLFIAFIGFNNAGLIRVNQGPIIEIIQQTSEFEPDKLTEAIRQAPPQVLELGSFESAQVIVTLCGLLLTIALLLLKVKGALFIGILLATLLGVPFQLTVWPDQISFSSISLAPTFMQMDMAGLLKVHDDQNLFQLVFGLFTVLLSFTLVDLFDTIGALIGTADKGGFLNKEGNLPRMNRSLSADALATTFGAILGTSTVTTYIESGAGIIEGGKTGLVAVFVSLFFLLSIFLTPVAGLIPSAATAPALIIVGLLMMGSVAKINFNQLEQSVPSFAIITLMPFSYSIANGIAAGIILHVFIKMVKLEFKKVHPIMYVLAALFILHFLVL